MVECSLYKKEADGKDLDGNVSLFFSFFLSTSRSVSQMEPAHTRGLGMALSQRAIFSLVGSIWPQRKCTRRWLIKVICICNAQDFNNKNPY